MIRTPAQLFAHFGADYDPADLAASNAALSHRVYKSTACGAWARFTPAGRRELGQRPEVWRVRLSPSVLGYLVSSARPEHGRTVHGSRIPLAVLLTCAAEGPRRVVTGANGEPMTRADLAALPIGSPLLARRAVGAGFLLRVVVEMPRRAWLPASVTIGSIVEGSDAECTPVTVDLPTTGAALDEAIAEVEAEADDLWAEANAEDTSDAPTEDA